MITFSLAFLTVGLTATETWAVVKTGKTSHFLEWVCLIAFTATLVSAMVH